MQPKSVKCDEIFFKSEVEVEIEVTCAVIQMEKTFILVNSH